MALTYKQGKQIRLLRERNLGYRAIAAQLGLSRDTVRNFCTAHHLSGVRAGTETKVATSCKYCGTALVQPPPRAKKKVLLGCVLPKVVVRKSAGDSAEPECRLWGHLSELRESVHGLRKQSPALLLPCLLYPASIWKLCLSMIKLIASA